MKKLIALLVGLAPLSVLAQTPIKNINDLSVKATNIGSTVVTLLISFAVIYIIWHVVRYFIAGGEEGRKAAGMGILWGVVGLFVILSIWGLVAILKNSFATDNRIPTEQIPKPLVPPRVP